MVVVPPVIEERSQTDVVTPNTEMEAVRVSLDSCWEFCHGGMAGLRRDFAKWKGRLDYLEVNMQVVVDDAIKKNLEHCTAELDNKLAASREKQFETGVDLIKEFEKIYVVHGRHAERLATTEMKLRMLEMELEKLRNTSAVDAPRSAMKKDVRDASSMDSFESCDEVHRSGKLPTSPNSCATLEADVGALRADVQRLVSSDMRYLIDDVKLVQIQSAEMLGIIELTKFDLQDQVQRMEATNSEKLVELTETLRREFHGMFRTGVLQKLENVNNPAVVDEHQYASSILISANLSAVDEGFVDQESTTNGNSNTQSVPSDTSQCGASDDAGTTKLDPDSEQFDPHSNLADGLREELLLYPRSKMKDHVLSVLREEHSQVVLRCQGGSPTQVYSTESSMTADSCKPPPACYPRISTVQAIPTPSAPLLSPEVRSSPSPFSSLPSLDRTLRPSIPQDLMEQSECSPGGNVRVLASPMRQCMSPAPNSWRMALLARADVATPRRTPSPVASSNLTGSHSAPGRCCSRSPSPRGASEQAETRVQMYAAQPSSTRWSTPVSSSQTSHRIHDLKVES